ncbi:hypothetical protein EMCG_02791 [[Emmonsia] crescens]|uniref:Uncharacterized protein n=1 Tax=[Emmonsia] crescens TaxID=73230 RepID=A0A0G2HX56_9EURO|nr:hypothetical protein EMCG_02791 [Emmonsia crescens UAMH 3008]
MARGDENDWRFGHITFDLNDYMPFLSTVKGIWKFHVEARRDGLGTEMSQLLPPPLKYEIGTDDVRRKELERYENEQYLTELINFAENPQPPTAEDMEVLETRSDSGN